MKSKEHRRTKPELQNSEEQNSPQQKPEVSSLTVIISSIGVLQIREKHNNGKTTSRDSVAAN